MIPLNLPAQAEPREPYVTRLAGRGSAGGAATATLIGEGTDGPLFAGEHGLLGIRGVGGDDLDGDIVLVTPSAGRVERLIRAGSRQNTLLVTERCDQLCLMCSQPPKKTHVDRFALLAEACLLAPADALIGISGGEPTLYKAELFDLVERVLAVRPDMGFHILSNGQHIEEADVERLAAPVWRRVAWGIPLYAADDTLHDEIVAKPGAADRLRESLARMIRAGARIELRTVIIRQNIDRLARLADFVATFLRPIEQWSIMQLEHVGFARNRWGQLYVDHGRDFAPVAVASISDWKRRYAAACAPCGEKMACTGFFEWHPDAAMEGVRPL